MRKGTGPVVCSAAMSLSTSKQRDTGAAAPVGYMQRQVHNSSFICSGTLASTAAAKTATSVVDAFNGGKTWHAVSVTHIIPAPWPLH